MITNEYKYLQNFNSILRALRIKMPAYYWGLYPCKDKDIKENIEIWNHYIAKNPKRKISFKDLKNEFNTEVKENYNNKIENLEREYVKTLHDTDYELLTEKISFLKDTFQLEKKRQSSIDNKFTQIIGQSSIVIAIVSIIIPVIIDKMVFDTEYLWLLIILGIFSGLMILFLTTSIAISIKNLKPQGYYRPMHTLILKHPKSKLNEFQFEEIKGFYDATNDNIKINDIKAENVNKAYTRFTLGIVMFLISSAIGTLYICLNPKEDVKKVSIENQVELMPTEKKIDSSATNSFILKENNTKSFKSKILRNDRIDDNL